MNKSESSKSYEQQIVEAIQEEASKISPLIANPLKGFCEIQEKRMLNAPLPTVGGVFVWNTLLELRGWRVQKNKLTGYVRILDDHNIRRAWGNIRSLRQLYTYLVRLNDQKFRSGIVSHTGLVFCGGGAKGAYQVGVWRRLRELGLEARINGVSGASVGALNSLLFAQGDLDLAEKVWFGIKEEDMKQLNPKLSALNSDNTQKVSIREEIKEAARFENHVLSVVDNPFLSTGTVGITGFFLDLLIELGKSIIVDTITDIKIDTAFELSEAGRNAANILFEGLYSREFLEKIIDQYISKEKVMDSNKRVYTAIAMPSLPKSPKDKARPQKPYGQVEYHCWDGLTFPEIKSYVFASSALPLAYGPVQIDGGTFVDGGLVDNEPAYPLVNAGFPKIIVVQLSSPDEEKKREKIRKKFSAFAGRSQIIHIWPSKSLGGTLEISPELTRERMDLGYADACAQLKGLAGPTSTRN